MALKQAAATYLVVLLQAIPMRVKLLHAVIP